MYYFVIVKQTLIYFMLTSAKQLRIQNYKLDQMQLYGLRKPCNLDTKAICFNCYWKCHCALPLAVIPLNVLLKH